MSQILAFDFGTFSIGVAIGQHITGTASPLAALRAKDGQPNWDEVAARMALQVTGHGSGCCGGGHRCWHRAGATAQHGPSVAAAATSEDTTAAKGG